MGGGVVHAATDVWGGGASADVDRVECQGTEFADSPLGERESLDDEVIAGTVARTGMRRRH